jgi:hypothetical protein
MATTTNYGWETADDTDLVKDGALAMRTLGSAIDTTVKALNPSTTLGDIEYRSSTANTNTRLPIGTTGQVLTVAGGVPTWATPAGGGGKVLQVVNAVKTDTFTTSSTTFTDITGYSVSITPSSSTSKILVFASFAAHGDAGNNSAHSRLVRGSTTILQSDAAGSRTQSLAMVELGSATMSNISVSYLDSPATTSTLTYKIQVRTAAQTIYINRTTADVDSSVWARGVSTITVMEIGA